MGTSALHFHGVQQKVVGWRGGGGVGKGERESPLLKGGTPGATQSGVVAGFGLGRCVSRSKSDSMVSPLIAP